MKYKDIIQKQWSQQHFLCATRMRAFAFDSLDSKEKSLKNNLVAFLESLGYKVVVGTLDVLSSHKKGDTLTHIKLWRKLQLLIGKKW